VTVPEQRSSNELAEVRTDLATHRTLMAADRSLMAWIRTGLSMISFGFTIFKILEGFAAAGKLLLPSEHTPRNVGLFLTGLGTFSVLIGTIEYRQTLRDLGNAAKIRLWRPSFVVAIVMSIFGVLLFASILANVL